MRVKSTQRLLIGVVRSLDPRLTAERATVVTSICYQLHPSG